MIVPAAFVLLPVQVEAPVLLAGIWMKTISYLVLINKLYFSSSMMNVSKNDVPVLAMYTLRQNGFSLYIIYIY